MDLMGSQRLWHWIRSSPDWNKKLWVSACLSSHEEVDFVVLQRLWRWIRSAPDWKKKLWVSAYFSFLFGYADAVSYQRYRAFGAMMTGNVVLFGYSLITFGMTKSTKTEVVPDCVYYAMISVAFFSGCVAYLLPKRHYGWPAWLMAPVVLLVIFVEIVNNYQNLVLAPPRWRVAYLAFVFGMQNTMLVKGPVGRIPGILMTTNLVNAGDIFVTVLLQGRDNVPIDQQREGLTILANMSSIILGAALGAWLEILVTDSCWLTLPIGVMLALGFSFTDAILAPDLLASPEILSGVIEAAGAGPYSVLKVEELAEQVESHDKPSFSLCQDDKGGAGVRRSAYLGCATPAKPDYNRRDSISSSESTAEPMSPFLSP
eukprot:TRINITY_DN7231_c0_g1_i1.p1 TRINITY_DN7231_c0_g1~~TRINITY_DN7231_c0_g1_i1.p1  ORF type:complete len:372 (+),score=26.45 TRINITY_DN7231_c0_g1_i1:126-1241(+)